MTSLNFEEAQQSYRDIFPNSPFFETWIPEEYFLSALRFEDNFSITRRGEKIYGTAFGEDPLIDSSWEGFSIESKGAKKLTPEFKVVDEWDCYWAPAIKGETLPIRISSDGEIENFLKFHAPQSSVFPGNEEIVNWIEVFRDEKLVGVAALCRWQSGRVVVSSVATHTEYRGQGVGRELMGKCRSVTHDLGEKFLCLGVMHGNFAAHRLYQSTGFTLMHNFTYCERR